MDILVLNGPNLNLLGIRDPDIYGNKTMDEVVGELRLTFPHLNIIHYQTNHEGSIIDKLQEVGFSYDGIILNAGGYTHTSIAIGDCVSAISTPVIELHISDIYSREDFRKRSFISDHAIHHIIGKGTDGYSEAIKWLINNVA